MDHANGELLASGCKETANSYIKRYAYFKKLDYQCSASTKILFILTKTYLTIEHKSMNWAEKLLQTDFYSHINIYTHVLRNAMFLRIMKALLYLSGWNLVNPNRVNITLPIRSSLDQRSFFHCLSNSCVQDWDHSNPCASSF